MKDRSQIKTVLTALAAAFAIAFSAGSMAQSTKPGAALSEPKAAAANAPQGPEAPNAKIRLTRKSPTYWKVTFANPPLNIVGPNEVRELAKILDLIEVDPLVQVVVFDSAVPGYFIAHWIASFDRHAIVETKKLVNLASLPPDSEMQPGWDAFIASVSRPEAQARLKALVDKCLQKPGDVEKHLGRYTAAYKK